MDFLQIRKVKPGKNRKATASTYKEKDSVASSHQFSSVQKYLGAGSIPPSPLRTVQPASKAPYTHSRNRNKSGLTKGINEHFLFLRKQNHLNTCYNLRKNKLKELTKANKQIFQKLNAQKSLYSNSQMSKSYKSIKQIKDRLSQSKISQRSLSRQSSRQSLKSSKSVRGILKKKEQKPMAVKALDINKANNREIIKFKGLFNTSTQNQKKTIENEEDVVKHNSYSKNGTYLRSMKIYGRGSLHSTKQTRKERGLRSQEGGLLHRIVEDLKQNKQTSVKKTR